MDRFENAMKETAADRDPGKLERYGAGVTEYPCTDFDQPVFRLVRWDGYRPPQTASQCAKMMVLEP